MNERAPDNPMADDDWLEQALAAEGHAHRTAYIADDGFTARVAGALPSLPALPAWRKPVVALLWGVTGVGVALALPGAVTDVAREVLRIAGSMAGSVTISPANLAAGVIAFGAATWTAVALALRNE
jgi:hypothetical protein